MKKVLITLLVLLLPSFASAQVFERQTLQEALQKPAIYETDFDSERARAIDDYLRQPWTGKEVFESAVGFNEFSRTGETEGYVVVAKYLLDSEPHYASFKFSNINEAMDVIDFDPRVSSRCHFVQDNEEKTLKCGSSGNWYKLLRNPKNKDEALIYTNWIVPENSPAALSHQPCFIDVQIDKNCVKSDQLQGDTIFSGSKLVKLNDYATPGFDFSIVELVCGAILTDSHNEFSDLGINSGFGYVKDGELRFLRDLLKYRCYDDGYSLYEYAFFSLSMRVLKQMFITLDLHVGMDVRPGVTIWDQLLVFERTQTGAERYRNLTQSEIYFQKEWFQPREGAE